MLRKEAGHRKNRNAVSEDFDADHPVAKMIMSLVPPDSEMDPDARRRMVAHLQAIQRRSAIKAEPVRASSRLRPLLVPAAAVLILALIAFTIVLPVFILDGGKPVVKARSATLKIISGNVRIKPPDSGWKNASDGMKITEGTSVKTGEDSYASVSFFEGSKVRINDRSEAQIKRIGTDSIAVRHVSGGTYHRVNKGTHYQVMNQDVVLRALGTAFNVDTSTKDNLEILTVESAVEVKIGEHNPIKVTEGEVMVVSMDEEKNADKQSVSRERLEDERLMSNVQQDAMEGYPTGIYEQVDVPDTGDKLAPGEESSEGVSLKGSALETAVRLEWSMTGDEEFDEVVLLRSEATEPLFPDNRIASYTDVSITSASDEGTQEGKTYQYRLCLVKDGSVMAYSNSVVINIPAKNPEPGPAGISLESSLYSNGVSLEWSVSGATRYSGFVLERVVVKAPENSQTPAGYKTVNRFNTAALLYTYLDTGVSPGHTYSYRVGLVVEGSVMVYSNKSETEVPGSMKL